MLMMNGNQIPSPQALSLTCLPREGGGITREAAIAWEELSWAQAADILGPCAAPVSLSFSDPVTGTRQTLAMGLVSALAETAREGAEGPAYRLLRLTLREAG